MVRALDEYLNGGSTGRIFGGRNRQRCIRSR
jgi:hypothetical protein